MWMWFLYYINPINSTQSYSLCPVQLLCIRWLTTPLQLQCVCVFVSIKFILQSPSYISSLKISFTYLEAISQ